MKANKQGASRRGEFCRRSQGVKGHDRRHGPQTQALKLETGDQNLQNSPEQTMTAWR